MANKSFTLINANTSYDDVLSNQNNDKEIDWKNCFICQEQTDSQMVSPASKPDGNYEKIIDDIKRFQPFKPLSTKLLYQLSSENIVSYSFSFNSYFVHELLLNS